MLIIQLNIEKLEVITRELLSNNWITGVLLFSFVLLSLMKLYQPNHLYGYATAFFLKGFLVKRAEDNPSFFSVFSLLLAFFSITTISLFVYFLIDEVPNDFSSFLFIFSVVIGFLIFRSVTDFLISRLFGISEVVRYFLFTKSAYLFTSCLLLFPVIIIFVYGYENSNMLLFYFIILLITRFLLIIINNKMLILNQLFYFILYLCALEIAPLLILYKLLTD